MFLAVVAQRVLVSRRRMVRKSDKYRTKDGKRRRNDGSAMSSEMTDDEHSV